MATRSGVITYQGLPDGCAMCTWTGLLNTDVGTPFDSPYLSDATVQCEGTPGAAASLLIEGSNDGTNYRTIRDATSATLNFATADLKQILENPRFIRPRVAAGDGTTNWTVTLVGKGMLR